MKKYFTLLILPFLLASCDVLEDIINESSNGLSDEEIILGLKEALEVGTDNSVVSASAVNGYYKNEIIKILLPTEVKKLQNTIETGSLKLSDVDELSGVSKFIGDVSIPYSAIWDTYLTANSVEGEPFEDLIQAMNRGAESAATKAKPIFVNAIVNMSIVDGLNILQGDSTAATAYFQDNTSTALVSAFQPDVRSALEQTQALGIYEDVEGVVNFMIDEDFLIDQLNIDSFFETQAFKLAYSAAGIEPISISNYIGVTLPESIDGYATEKAVGGLFHLVGEEEKKIRKNPFAWASDIIEKVFSSVEANWGA
ncbi:DUF4197 domain-containing protein [Reichenbachiella versicolor]|uniref:DUF4197 domain-containing protein n=1 Tax=Reichenbachiella versicolor TaxID=1821036 RepID=UPI000D6E849D|nr:DUF4197 domain-containing protein [Reichenbachiella versicolor]